MYMYRIDDKLVYDVCEHLEYKNGKFTSGVYEEGFTLGKDKDGLEHILILCAGCGERIERKMVINFLNRLKLNVRIKNGSVVELNSKDLWRTFLNLLHVN